MTEEELAEIESRLNEALIPCGSITSDLKTANILSNKNMFLGVDSVALIAEVRKLQAREKALEAWLHNEEYRAEQWRGISVSKNDPGNAILYAEQQRTYKEVLAKIANLKREADG